MKKIITKTALFPDLKIGVFYRAVFGIVNFALKGGALNPKFTINLYGRLL